ncbi:MAG: hypothetical protein ACQERC_11595 [Bacteroidota bacterium]
MPKIYYNKSTHNKTFLKNLCEDYPEDYFDWKVTVQFYSGLHRCYCVLANKGEVIQQSHSKNIKNLKAIDANISRKLFKLYKNSKQSRYDGFLDEEAMLRINRINFNDGSTLLKSIETEVEKYYSISSAV